MPYDIPVAPQLSPRHVRARAQLEPNPQSSTTEVTPIGADNVRRIEPMLLVHQERVETFRLIASALRRGLKALARPYAA